MWTRIIVTSGDLRQNGHQPTTRRDNLAVSKAVFIADVIFALFYAFLQSLAGSRFPHSSSRLEQEHFSKWSFGIFFIILTYVIFFYRHQT